MQGVHQGKILNIKHIYSTHFTKILNVCVKIHIKKIKNITESM